MKREALDKLQKWKEKKNRKPLLLTGVRQCGKTYLIKEFGKNEFGYKTIKEGIAGGKLIGGNLSLTRAMVAGKYNIDFSDKILFC